jgi:hypothetical protein
VQAWRVEVPAPITAAVGVHPSQVDPPMAIPVDMPAPNYTAYGSATSEPRFFAPPPVQASSPVYVPPASTQAPYPFPVVFGQQPVGHAPLAANSTIPLALGVPTPQWQIPTATAQPPLPFLLLPVLAVNRLFDAILYLFGPLGSLLRQPAGRNLLGWLGILMLLSAIGWGVADWYGLDWTR